MEVTVRITIHIATIRRENPICHRADWVKFDKRNNPNALFHQITETGLLYWLLMSGSHKRDA